MNKQAVFDEFVKHAARAFFASAWADQEEESGNAQGGEIMDRMPEEIDPAAIYAARTLAMDIEHENRKTIAKLMELVETMGCGDRPATVEYFGHYCAMQAMGHGVGLYDAFGEIVANVISVPYVAFGGYSLERDYFEQEGEDA